MPDAYDRPVANLVALPGLLRASRRGINSKTCSALQRIGEIGFLKEIELMGVPISDVIRPFRKPQTNSDGQAFIDIRMPIVCDEKKCTDCGICAKIYPGEAITFRETPEIDYDRCVQCFCCMELCLEGALRAIKRVNP